MFIYVYVYSSIFIFQGKTNGNRTADAASSTSFDDSKRKVKKILKIMELITELQ